MYFNKTCPLNHIFNVENDYKHVFIRLCEILYDFLMYFDIYTGRKIAIDASMCMYQFLIAVRQDGNVLQNEDGETTRYI